MAPFAPNPAAEDGTLALMPAPAERVGGEPSQMQLQLLRRVRRMYIEKVIRESEKIAYDERVDIKASVTNPMARISNALAHLAMTLFWAVSLILTVNYTTHLGGGSARRWFYALLCSWFFTWLVLELIRILLITIMELQQLYHRQRSRDHSKLSDLMAAKREAKRKAMNVALGDAFSILPARPALGDASAG